MCGRPYCCNAFLNDFHPVSIKMAKTQNLSLNPTKISGACGRLMCCLKYEQEAYEDVLKRTPKLESLVETPDGVGTVNSVQLLREKVKVRLDDDPENPGVYSNADITVIRSGKGKRPAAAIAPTGAAPPGRNPPGRPRRPSSSPRRLPPRARDRPSRARARGPASPGPAATAPAAAAAETRGRAAAPPSPRSKTSFYGHI